MMADYLKDYHIHYGADMTLDAALAKMSYLLGKYRSPAQIIPLLSKNLRG